VNIKKQLIKAYFFAQVTVAKRVAITT